MEYGGDLVWEIGSGYFGEPWTEVVGPPCHTEFSDAQGLLHFVAKLRQARDGKPVGFLCRAMVNTGIQPEFITVDGGEGGTGAAPIEFSDSVGMPLEEALVFVTDTLRGFGLRREIRLVVAGRIITGFDIVRAWALGADLCNSARGDDVRPRLHPGLEVRHQRVSDGHHDT